MPAQKKIKQTDAIFARLDHLHARCAESERTLRLSLDAKAIIQIGPFSRGGKSRTGTKAVDHDFKPEGTLTPFGLWLPEHDELELYFTASKVTADFIVDVIEDWWDRSRDRFAHVNELVLDMDNGPENYGHRSQFLYRLVRFAQKEQLRIQLAYYPPYHSKYNPIERCWAALENYWRGELLNSVEAILGYATEMTYKGRHANVYHCTTEYKSGVRRTEAQKREIEQYLYRAPGLEKWAVTIPLLA